MALCRTDGLCGAWSRTSGERPRTAAGWAPSRRGEASRRHGDRASAGTRRADGAEHHARDARRTRKGHAMRIWMLAIAVAVGGAACEVGEPVDGEAPVDSGDEGAVDQALVRGALAHEGAGLAAADRVEVTFTLENPSDRPIDLLRWGTPL